MNEKISSRQLYFFLACVAPVGKLVFLPTELAKYAKNDLLLPLLVQFALQAAAVFCVLLAARREQSFYDLVADMGGAFTAKVLSVLLALFLAFATLLPILEQKTFVQSVFYDTLPSILSFAPYFLFAAYVLTHPLPALGRIWDVLAPIFLVGMAGILILSFGACDFGALLPVGAAGAKGFGRGVMLASSWFFDAAVLLSLLGKFRYRRGMAWKGTLAYVAGGAIVLLFFAVFYAVFAETAMNQLFAFAKTSKYFAGITVLGRIDYLFIFALAIVMAYASVLPAQAGVSLLSDAFSHPKYLSLILGISLAVLYFILSLLLDYRFGQAVNLINGPLFWLFPLFSVLLPAATALVGRKA